MCGCLEMCGDVKESGEEEGWKEVEKKDGTRWRRRVERGGEEGWKEVEKKGGEERWKAVEKKGGKRWRRRVESSGEEGWKQVEKKAGKRWRCLEKCREERDVWRLWRIGHVWRLSIKKW